ncbi:hypothetical protein N9W57_01425 [Pseudomonadales bacterium]|nr:hypothetical protein [Pseudomonadales bacterium]
MTATLSPQQVRANRIKLVLLWSVPFGLMAIAGLVYTMVQSGYISVGSKNEGVLIRPPIQLSELALTTSEAVDKSSLWQDKWSIVVRGSADCDSTCSETLLLTRQIHIRLNKEANRVQRVYLSTESALSDELTAHLATENHYMKVAVVNSAADQLNNSTTMAELDTALAGSNQAARFFIVDPDGWAMMYYLDEHDGGAILKDLKYLLKYSKER